MDIKEKIKQKITGFIINNSIFPTENSPVPINDQAFFLSSSFDDEMLNVILMDLLEDAEALHSFLGDEIFYDPSFKQYINSIK